VILDLELQELVDDRVSPGSLDPEIDSGVKARRSIRKIDQPEFGRCNVA
jgi:hypothetical protein